MYCTNYRILDKETNELVFKNINTACFHEFFLSKNDLFKKGRKMEVFYPINNISSSEDLVNFWVEELNKLSMIIKISKIDFDPTDVSMPPKGIRGQNYVWTLDFDDYDSLDKVKFACHLLRYLYETYMYKIIEDVYNEKQRDPSQCSFELIQYISVITSKSIGGGHITFYQGIIRKIATIDDLNKVFETWSKSGPSVYSITTFIQNYYIKDGSTMKLIGSNHPINVNIHKYKDRFKDLDLEGYKKEVLILEKELND